MDLARERERVIDGLIVFSCVAFLFFLLDWIESFLSVLSLLSAELKRPVHSWSLFFFGQGRRIGC